MDNISVIQKQECSGCGACAQVCPRSCIRMKPDKEGFLYPDLDSEACIRCGKCVRVCPVKNVNTHAALVSCAAVNQNAEMLKNSSSGAIFPLLAQTWIREGGYVCGAEMMEDLTVKHTVTNTLDGLKRMQGSKYVQSDASGVYGEMKDLLDAGKKVMFVGTPCQASAVRNLFARNLEQMLLVDLICHGVPSQEFFRRHVNRTYPNRIGKVSFRDKTPCESSCFRLTVRSAASTRHIQPNRDAYYNLFLKSASYRESCYGCRYAQAERVGDITIGDCSTRGTYSCFPYAAVVNTVLLSTPTGQRFWDKVKSDVLYCELDLPAEAKRNHQLREPSKRPEIRDVVYQDFQNLPKKAFEKKYTYRLPLPQTAKRTVKNMVPLKVKGNIKKLCSAIRINKGSFFFGQYRQ